MLYKEPFVLYLNISVCIILLFLALPSLLNRKEELKVRLAFFMIFFIVIATCLINVVVLHSANYSLMYLGWIVFFFSLSFGPAIYVYIKSLLGSKVSKSILFSQLPGLATLLYGIYLALADSIVQRDIFRQMLSREHLFYEITNLLTLVLTLFYCVKSWLFIRKFKVIIKDDGRQPFSLKVAWAREFILYMFANVFVFLLLVLILTNVFGITTMDMDLIGMPVFMLVVYLLVAVRSMMMYKEFEHQYVIAGIENEKKIQAQRFEIARDLHDSLGAQLTFIASVSDSLKRNVADLDEHLKTKTDTLSEFTDNAISELKNALWVLNADEISLEDVRSKLLNFIKAAGEARENVEFHFTFTIQENYSVDSKWAVSLFRIIQELINNALKYSQATDIWIEAEQVENFFKLVIRDNGIGFDRDVRKSNSYGLTNLKNRVQIMDGTLQIESEKGKGTECFIKIPLR